MTSTSPVGPAPTTFAELGLSAAALHDVAAAGYLVPTPIQAGAIPPAMAGHDLVGCAQTGTGKTAAFVLPILERLDAVRARGGRRATAVLVLAPTRELALQITDVFQQLSRSRRLTITCAVGGVGLQPQIKALSGQPDVLVATPGRLIDLMERRAFQPASLEILVLDEADRMLDMGFAPQLRRIVSALPTRRQTMLFSATMPDGSDIGALVKLSLKDPVRVSVGKPRGLVARAEQVLLEVGHTEKSGALLDLLDDESGSVLIFTRTKHRADRLAKVIERAGHRCVRLHGNRSQAQRVLALDSFRSGKARILVATDIAARGLDVEDVAHVVNFDLPQDPEDYVHRIGRTARAEKTGRATTFVMPEEKRQLGSIARYVGSALPQPRRPQLRATESRPA